MAVSPGLFARAAAILMLTVLLLGIIPLSEAAINPVPALSIRLDTSSLEARVSESAQGTAPFTGSVSLDKLPVERVVVDLTVSTDTGWAAAITPSTMVFTSTQPQSFSVTVIVPQATPVTPTGTLTITGRAQGGGFQDTTTTTGTIVVAPYYRLQIESDAPYREIAPGSQTFYSFKVWNQGNAIDSYELEIVNLKDIVGKGWTVTLSTTQIARVNAGEYRVVKITAQAPRTPTVWKNEPTMITVRATSLGARETGQQLVSQTYPLYAYEHGGPYLPGFNPLFLMAALAIGAVLIKRNRQ
ncbi:MAG: choice-of-anchor T family protein [Thermoplasmata archaeon]